MHVNRFSRRMAAFHDKMAPKITAEHSAPDYGPFQIQVKGKALLSTLHECISCEGR